MLNDIQITSDYMSRWVVLKRRVGAVTSQRVFKVLMVLKSENLNTSIEKIISR
jgi:diacylglycerol kinase